MRAVQLALLVILIQVGTGLVAESGLFTGNYFESSIVNSMTTQNISALSESEQIQASINVMNSLFNILTWGWIKKYFEPFYSMDVGVKNFVDSLILFLNSVSLTIIGVAFIEFIRNRINVLGG